MYVQKHAKGQMLLQKVYNHVDLLEVKYFGLQFTDNYDVNVCPFNSVTQPRIRPNHRNAEDGCTF